MTRLLVLGCLLASLVALVPAGGDEKEDVGTVIGIDLGTTYSWYGFKLQQNILSFIKYFLCF